MDLATMRTKLVELSANTLSASDPTTLDELLNGAYQSTIPGMLPGEGTEGYWDLVTVASTGEYAYPAWLIAARRVPPRFTVLDQYSIGFGTYPETFWRRYDLNDTTEGRPCDALFYGRTVTLRPIPDQAYTIRIWARVGNENPIPTTGIADRNMALCAVALAATEHAELTGNGEIEAAAGVLLERHFGLLLTQSFARSRGPRARVSY